MASMFHHLLARAGAGNATIPGVLSGGDPTEFNSSNPITLFIIQLCLIIAITSALGWVFDFILQPKVIAEVIGGILLGPTAFGQIDGFSAHIFPQKSIPYLNLVANIGLVLFLFLIGLEVDVGVMKRNYKSATAISAAGMVLPFGIGAALAVGIYNNYVDRNVEFGHFLLFVGVAMSITAFPVLCRILTSTKLLDTRVGVVVLSAGVGNDVVGWVLLALTIALSNAGSGVTAVYILLCAVGWTLILLIPIKRGFYWLAKRTGSLENGPTPFMITISLMITFISAFVTDVIGVHAIFGGFLAGLIIPHKGGFAIALTEKIEDLVTMLFLPIYFVLSGLNTDLTLLKEGKDWGWTILICVCAFAAKFIGCAGAAKLAKYSTRESAAVGMLMSCKGLVELIVLNVGLAAGIIDRRVFSMFVFQAVLLTFITTPLTLLVYPRRFHTRANAIVQQSKDTEGRAQLGLGNINVNGSGVRDRTSRFLVVLQKIEHLAPVMFLSQMLESPLAEQSTHAGLEKQETTSAGSSPHHKHTALPEVSNSALHMDALRLIELTGRTFSVMQSAEKEQMLLSDDTLQLFRHYGRLRGFDVTPYISIVGQESFPAAVSDHARETGTELVVIPWTVPAIGTDELIRASPSSYSPDSVMQPSAAPSSPSTAPYDNLFGPENHGSPLYTPFLRRVFVECPTDVALFVDRGFSAGSGLGSGQHIFMPFFGGPDDRLALSLVVQFCHHSHVTATVVKIDTDGSEAESSNKEMSATIQAHHSALQSNQLTLGGNTVGQEAQSRLASDTADDLAWAYYTSEQSHSPSTTAALGRIQFSTTRTARPLAYITQQASASISTAHSWRPLLVVVGRGRRAAVAMHGDELAQILSDKGQNPSQGAEIRKTVGDVATALVVDGGKAANASFLILQSGKGR